MKSLDKYVIFSIMALIIYAIAERTLSAMTGNNADTLTACFYAAFGGEILSCCLIKIFKLKAKEEGYNAKNDDVFIDNIDIDEPNHSSDQDN